MRIADAGERAVWSHERMPDRVGMRTHFDGALARGPALQGLQGFERDSGERLHWHIKGSEAEVALSVGFSVRGLRPFQGRWQSRYSAS